MQGIVDAPYLALTPGTRLGVIHDEALARLVTEIVPLETRLATLVEDQQRAEEERASRDVLRSVQGALKEALLALPAEEYDWFDLHRGEGKRRPRTTSEATSDGTANSAATGAAGSETVAAIEQGIEVDAGARFEGDEPQRQFFEYAGPLFLAMISPTSSVVEVGGTRALRAMARDRARRLVERDLKRAWNVVEGDGTLDPVDAEIATFRAGNEPGLVRVAVTVT